VNTKTINRLFELVTRNVFGDATLDYERVTDAIIVFANTIAETETDSDVWYIGENGPCDLGSFVVGAYWHYTAWHGGQWSNGYAALCALGRVYNPNRASGPEPESCEAEAYQALEEMVIGESLPKGAES